MIGTSASETLWAEHGLTGLVLFALFGLIGVFLKVLTKKDEQLKQIIDDEREERERTSERTNLTTNRLSMAIDGLAKELRNNHINKK